MRPSDSTSTDDQHESNQALERTVAWILYNYSSNFQEGSGRMGESMSPSQAARELGCSVENVRRLMKAGKLAFTETPLGRIVSVEAVAAMKDARQGAR